MTKTVSPTMEVYENLQKAFDKLNEAIFDNSMPQVIITLQRKKNVVGFFCKDRFGKSLDEIAMNPQYTNLRSPMETLSTLAHEMVHQWQHIYGTVTKSNHHNAEWAAKMHSIGLPPRPTKPGGKITGSSVTHAIDPNGLFASVATEILKVVDLDRVGDVAVEGPPPVRKSGKYMKYTCPCCKSVARGKKDMTLFCANDHEVTAMLEEGTDAFLTWQISELTKLVKVK